MIGKILASKKNDVGRDKAQRWEVKLTGSRDDNRDNEAVDTEDTSHDNGNDGLDDELGLQDGHRADTDTGLGSSVGGSEVAENEGSHDAHTSEEKSLVGVTVHYTNIHIVRICKEGPNEL